MQGVADLTRRANQVRSDERAVPRNAEKTWQNRRAEKLISPAISGALRPVRSKAAKISLDENQKSCFIAAIPPRQEGRSANRHQT